MKKDEIHDPSNMKKILVSTQESGGASKRNDILKTSKHKQNKCIDMGNVFSFVDQTALHFGSIYLSSSEIIENVDNSISNKW